MFDKYRARFAKFEEDHESVRKAKKHVEKHQTTYAAIGGSAITLVAVKVFGGPQVIVREAQNVPTVITNTVSPIFNNHNVGNQLIQNVGHCTKIVQRLSDKEIFEQAGDAAFDIAEKHGIAYDRARWMLSRHLNGWLDDVYGETYKTIGLGTTN